jgi:hypothetical protein
MALAPISGWSPAWEDFPSTSSRNVPAPFRAITYSPPGRAGSRMPTEWARRAWAWMRSREVRERRSSSALKTIVIAVSAQARVPASRWARSA